MSTPDLGILFKRRSRPGTKPFKGSTSENLTDLRDIVRNGGSPREMWENQRRVQVRDARAEPLHTPETIALAAWLVQPDRLEDLTVETMHALKSPGPGPAHLSPGRTAELREAMARPPVLGGQQNSRIVDLDQLALLYHLLRLKPSNESCQSLFATPIKVHVISEMRSILKDRLPSYPHNGWKWEPSPAP